MRKTVTLSLSLKPETYQKVMIIKGALEAERLETVHMSTLIDRLITLGIAYRELLALQNEKNIKPKQIELVQEGDLRRAKKEKKW